MIEVAEENLLEKEIFELRIKVRDQADAITLLEQRVALLMKQFKRVTGREAD